MKSQLKLLIIWVLGLLCLPMQALKAQTNANTFGDLKARHIGPAVMSGRVSAMTGHPTDPKVLYVGAAGGGVWKSTDGGVVFRSVFDEYDQSIGAIAVAPSNPSIIWVGTGEPWVRNSVSPGTGIYKSTDEGRSWQWMGLPEAGQISRIVIHPQNSDIVYVGVQGQLWRDSQERGVYQTTDGGKTWNKILYQHPGTGCADLAIDPKNPNVLYAAMWEHRRQAFFFTSGGPNSGLYKTTDGGKTWNKTQQGLPKADLGRMGIGLAPSNPNILYLTVEAAADADKGMYRSDDAGASWKRVNSDFSTNVRPFYFSRLVIDPKNPERVYKAGLDGAVSSDGGKTFRQIGSGVHSDIHDFWVNPTNSEHVLLGTDGGVYRSWDGANTFEMVRSLPISQFYHVSTDNETPYNIYGGLQDNGSWYGPSRSPNGIQNKDWTNVGGGDGFRVYRHPTLKDVIYCEMQGGGVWKYNTTHYTRKTIQPLAEQGDPKLRFNWNSPIALSKHNPDRIYVGSQFLHKSDNQGDTWVKISPDLTTNDPKKQQQHLSGGLSIDNSSAENHCTIFAIAESPLDQNIVWIGTDDGNVQVTFDGGKTWRNTTPNLKGLPKNTWCAFVEPSHFDKNTAYAVFDGHTQGDEKVYVYKTTDGGQTWTALPTEGIKRFARVIREDLVQPSLLFLGTEEGLYISLDAGQTWAKFTNNMPNAAIHWMEIQPQTHDLVIATHGRGIIIIDNISPLRLLTPEVLTQELYLFPNQTLFVQSSGSYQDYSGAGEFVGENPTSIPQITYYMAKRHTFGKMSMEVFDAEGKKVADLAPGKSAGINRVGWQIQRKAPRTAKGKTFAFGSLFSAPTLPEGTYTVRIIKDKSTFEQTLTLQANPNSPYTAAEREAQNKLAIQLYDMTEQLAYLVDQIELMQNAATQHAQAQPKLKKGLDAWYKELETFKATLVITSGDNYVASAENQLRENIADLYSAVTGYAGKPSDAQQRNAAVLAEQLQKAQSRLEEIKQKDLAKWNNSFEKEGLPPIALKSFEEFMGQ